MLAKTFLCARCALARHCAHNLSSPGRPPEKVLEDQSKSQEILIPVSEVTLKHAPQNFHGEQIAEHIQECEIKGNHSWIYTICLSNLQKPDDVERLILNLKELNEFAKYSHFKMDGIRTIINMVTGNQFMVSIDLQDAYYSVYISKLFQKFLKFRWKDKLYCFTCFLNFLESCPRKFIKFNKVTIKSLHFENVPLSGYLHDFFTKGNTFSIYEENIHKTMRL